MTGDWRLTGQQRYLRGVELIWSGYRARSPEWEHDHCTFCWMKFVDPETGPEQRELVESGEALEAGFTTTGAYRKGARYEWICRNCFDDFRDEFGWVVASH